MSNKPTIFSIPKTDIKNHYRLNYQNQNWLQKEFNTDSLVIDLEEFYLELRQEFIQLLIQKKIINDAIPLEQLHQYIDDDLKMYGNDGLGRVGTLLYDNNDNFVKVLRNFIHKILFKKIIQKPFLFQATPTFRIHCPNAGNSHFFPHYHTDLAVGHSPREINLWIPLTLPLSGHGFYLANLRDSKTIGDYIDFDLPSLMEDSVFRDSSYLNFCKTKFLPVNVASGMGLIFDGRCFHTAMPILSHTRVSVDFRIILEEDFVAADYIYQNYGRRKQLLMLPDHYYYEKNSAELEVS